MIDFLYLATDNHSLEVLETIKDSLTVVLPQIREMAENSKPEPYTIQNITIASWNLLIAVVAALFGFLGALFGYLGYKFSKQTARNVVRVSADVQLDLCYDFIIDLYRNTMRAIIYGQAYKDKKDLQINNIIALKLTCFDDIFHIDAYNQNSDVYIIMKHLKDRIQNYNEEIELCCDNIKKGRDLSSDFYNMSWKQMQILLSVKHLLKQIKIQKDYTYEIFSLLIKKHIKHITSNRDYFLNIYNIVGKHKYNEYIHEHSKLKKRIDALFEDVNPSIPNCLFVDVGNTSKIQEQYEEIIKVLPMECDYVSLIKKKEWKRSDLNSLLVNMIVIDAVIDSQPYNEA